MIRILLFTSLFFTTLAFSMPQTEQNSTTSITEEQNNLTAQTDILEEQNSSSDQVDSLDKAQKKEELLARKANLDKEILDNNIWSKIYSNYHIYIEFKKDKAVLDNQINILDDKYKRTVKENEALEILKNKKSVLIGKLQLLEEYGTDPFKKFLTPPVIEEVPTVGNPIAVISAISYQEKLKSDQEEYHQRYESLQTVMEKMKEKEKVVEEIFLLDANKTKYGKELLDIKDKIKTFAPVLDIFKTTQNVHTKKIDEIKLNLQSDIKRELEKTMNLGAIILFFILFLLFVKYLVRRYMSDNDRFYTINKALNATFFTALVFILLFAYIENVSYLVTILGFASAGIAIAMKDWFMSIMGWLTIMFGGAIHVGDRVKFVRDGVEYVGDIVDISLLRMTMHEDVTLTTSMVNRRAGRIIFIPNNFIFTDMIANYSHAGLKTVWDGIDVVVTFDSDIHKASSIAKEVAKKYSKGYTDITRKQINKLRSQYSMKNTNVEPRVFTLIEPYGMKISIWYLTNSYATLTLRSTISAEIISRMQEEESILLAFPTQSIYVDKDVRKPKVEDPTLFDDEI
ncbi:mechanosensitive ion channel domain-containing protein [Sulfurovum sp. CS9]|uniref:mechanosensitive ion channel domain-containing protein n=1 Tax=Sulfurovum sp. CS9 TaxID=3391146 RepID=UPI0039E7652D